MRKIISLMIVVFLVLPFVVGSPKTILFNPNQLINITGVRCLEQNNSLCNEDIACNISIINQSGAFLFANETMDVQSNSFRSFNTELTFTTEFELSSVVDCDNGGVEEFIIKIEFNEDTVDTTYGIYGFLLATASMFFVLGLKKDRYIYKTFSGFMLILMGLNIIINGFPNIVNAFVTESSGMIFIGLGAIFILTDVSRLGGLLE